jgi:hypothetical protein
MLAATSIGERGTQLALRTFHSGGVAGWDTMAGFPHIRALLLGQRVPVRGTSDDNDWTRVAAGGRTDLAKGSESARVALSLDDVMLMTSSATPEGGEPWATTDPLVCVLRVFLFEMFSNYSPEEVEPRHFELLLAALIEPRAASNGEDPQACSIRVRSLLDVARSQSSPLDALAFGYARQAVSRFKDTDYPLGPSTKVRLLGGVR